MKKHPNTETSLPDTHISQTVSIKDIYETDDLQQIKAYLSTFTDTEKLRNELFSEFLEYCRYENVSEWNKAVRICECLAITGWGDKEPLEAIRGYWFNGNPNTYFINRNSKTRFFDAVWSKRKDGLAIDFNQSSFHESPDSSISNIVPGKALGEMQDIKLKSQRNWIPKNPIFITRIIANCYENSRAVIESVEKSLMQELNRRMRPELYGNAIDRITIECSFSFYDDYYCKSNYIIADESLKLKEKDFYWALLEMYSEKEIADNGYYLRNRFKYGPFRKDSGTCCINISFEKEFSEMPQQRQKQLLCDYFIHAVRETANRLSKKIDYNFDLMITDFSTILQDWLRKE